MNGYYRVQADIDLSAIRKNIETMHGCIPQGKKMLVVLKANAYGHGAIEIARELDDLSDYYGVACIEEGIELRKAGIRKPVLILGHTDESQFGELVAYDITQTIFSYDQAKILSDISGKTGKKGKLHIKLDTGMNRIGYPCTQESVEEIVRISKLPDLNMEGIFTHYFKADEKDKSSALKQLEMYTGMIQQLEQAGVHFPIRHISNSAGIMEMPNDTYDMVRSGISTYGLYPSEEMDKEACILFPAMSLKSCITHIKQVKKGETIGYGGSYTLQEDRMIATIGVGYADGYPRALSNRGRMLIRGRYVPIVGRVCMDQTMVDITDVPEAKVGDEVVLVGRQGEHEISVEELASFGDSFNYEFVCNVNRRVPRIFYKNGEAVEEKNYLF